jgi:FxsC-like protein
MRKVTECYGSDAQDWRPYHPSFKRRIGAYAQGVASEDDLSSRLVTIDDDLLNLLATARNGNEIVVLLVDSWTIRLLDYHEILKQYDRLNSLNCAVILPWNQNDPETTAQAATLQDAIYLTFPNNILRGDVKVFREMVGTPEAFAAELREVLTETRRRIVDMGKVARRAVGDNVIVRPLLVGPGA